MRRLVCLLASAACLCTLFAIIVRAQAVKSSSSGAGGADVAFPVVATGAGVGPAADSVEAAAPTAEPGVATMRSAAAEWKQSEIF